VVTEDTHDRAKWWEVVKEDAHNRAKWWQFVKEDAHNRAKWWQVVKTMTIRNSDNFVDLEKRIKLN